MPAHIFVKAREHLLRLTRKRGGIGPQARVCVAMSKIFRRMGLFLAAVAGGVAAGVVCAARWIRLRLWMISRKK
jgi:hypothetical protein